MSRIVEIVVPVERTDALLTRVGRVEELLSLRVQRGGSLRPPGDVVTVGITNRALHDLVRILADGGFAEDPGASITISEPSGVISPASQEAVASDTTDLTWEEMEFTIARDSNMAVNGMIAMAGSGALAATGIATDALHLVIAGMLIAPGFEPIMRISLGLAARSRTWRHGMIDTLKGYAAMLAGAAAAAVVLRAMGRTPGTGEAYLPGASLLSYWVDLSGPGTLVAAMGGIVGAVLVANNRSILTAGVMVALALVPPIGIVGLALVAADPGLAGQAALRWSVDVVLVAAMALGVFVWKRSTVQRREMII